VRGTVTDFDERRGLGEVTAGPEGDEVTYPFHCTAIVDGSRTIVPGTPVSFAVRPGGMGRWEATAVAPLAIPVA
jgi:''Cold-shock'' DNA-binding domain.